MADTRWFVDASGNAVDWSSVRTIDGWAHQDVYLVALDPNDPTSAPFRALWRAHGAPLGADEVAAAQAVAGASTPPSVVRSLPVTAGLSASAAVGGAAVTVASVVSAAATLVANRLTPVNASSGPLGMALPAATSAGQTVVVTKTDSSANVVNVNGTIGGSASSTVALTAAGDTVSLISDGSGSWWIASAYRSTAASDARYLRRSDTGIVAYDATNDVVAVTVSNAATPAAVLDLTRWYLTLPYEDPSVSGTTTPLNVFQPALASFSDVNDFYVGSDGASVVYVAPAQGVTTSAASGATRSELREMADALSSSDLASWGFGDGKTHSLTCTLTADPSAMTIRKEVIVGQIHDNTGTPPVYLSVNNNSGVNSVDLFISATNGGPSGKVMSLLTGYVPGTQFTYRIVVTGGKLSVYAAYGDVTKLPATANYTLAGTLFANQSSTCYFKAGAYNKEDISQGGTGFSTVTHSRLDLV